MRCDWCGIPQSEDWHVSDLGTFCSKECSKASGSGNFLGAACLSLVIPPIFLSVWFLPESMFDTTIKLSSLIGGVIMELMVLAIAISDYQDRRYTAKIPKGSRRHIGVSKVMLLQRVSAPIECPTCDGNIDLRSIGEDMVYTCQYCGANGVIDIKLQS